MGVWSYIVASLWLPQANVLGSKTNNVALIVHDARPGTASTDIDTNVVVDMRANLVAWIGHLA